MMIKNNKKINLYQSGLIVLKMQSYMSQRGSSVNRFPPITKKTENKQLVKKRLKAL